MPKAKAAFAGGFVVTTDCIRRQRCQAFRISTSEHYIFRLQRILQLSNHIEDVFSPLLLSESLQSRSADVLFETSSILVRKVSQLHRLKYAVNNQRGSHARTQTEKEHATGAVASERLHSSVINDLHRNAERFIEIESDPAFAEVGWIVQRLSIHDRSRITDRNHVVVPTVGCLLDRIHQLLWRHRRTKIDLHWSSTTRGADLHEGAADVEHQDFLSCVTHPLL